MYHKIHLISLRQASSCSCARLRSLPRCLCAKRDLVVGNHQSALITVRPCVDSRIVVDTKDKEHETDAKQGQVEEAAEVKEHVLCQVHRKRWLDGEEEIPRDAEHHGATEQKESASSNRGAKCEAALRLERIDVETETKKKKKNAKGDDATVLPIMPANTATMLNNKPKKRP